MPNYFPPTPVYPINYDTDETLFVVYNTSETFTSSENSAWASEIEIEPVDKDHDEIWADNGFANINGELFYYGSVERTTSVGSGVIFGVIQFDEFGGILGVSVLDGGSGYGQSPTIKVNGNLTGGRGAELKAIVEDGEIISIKVLNSGNGYKTKTLKIDANNDFQFVGKINKFTRCARNLGGNKTRKNPAGTEVRGFVIAEHHNQIVQTILNMQNFIGESFSTDTETLDYRIRNLAALPVIFDDFTCPDVSFNFFIVSDDPATGILAQYDIIVDGTYTTYRLDFGDGEFTTSSLSGTHRYAPNSIIDPILTLTNSKCTIVQSPVERDLVTEPQAAAPVTPFEIKLPVIPTLPPFVIPDIPIPSTTVNIPPIVFPCIDVGPIGPINIPSVITVEPPIDIPSVINFEPPLNIPSVISFDPPLTIPSKITIEPPIDIPPVIQIQDDIPSVISLVGPTIPPVITVNDDIPTVINVTDDIPTVISVNDDIPTVISVNDDIPGVIQVSDDIPKTITIEDDIPDYIVVFDDIPPVITVVDDIPPVIRVELPEIPPFEFFVYAYAEAWAWAEAYAYAFAFADASAFAYAYAYAYTYAYATVNVVFDDVPCLSVCWGTPSAISVVVSVTCPSTGGAYPSGVAFRGSSLGQDYENDFFDPVEINVGELGIPSVINLNVPEIPDIRVIHDIPALIRIETPKIADIQVVTAADFPREIKLVADGIPSTIELVADIPSSIRIDSSDMPSFIKLTLPDEMPTLKIDASQIPSQIQVIGIPSTIELVGAPSEIKLVLPDEPEIELVYKGAPIDVKINLDISRLTGDENNQNCVSIVPCNPKN